MIHSEGTVKMIKEEEKEQEFGLRICRFFLFLFFFFLLEITLIFYSFSSLHSPSFTLPLEPKKKKSQDSLGLVCNYHLIEWENSILHGIKYYYAILSFILYKKKTYLHFKKMIQHSYIP